MARKRKRIGLALSGGGYRAAAFHLGVLGKLSQLEILDQVDVISCVSGGAITGGFFALQWPEFSVTRFRDFILNQSLLAGSIIGGILSPFKSRTEKLAEAYDEFLFAGRTLDDLKNAPRTYINATNMANGKLFMFVGGAGGKSEMGDWDLKFVEANGFPVSLAAAASSAYPPVFPPLKLPQSMYPAREPFEYVTLADGGIYDNLGVNPLVNKINKIDYIIISDGGSPLVRQAAPSQSGPGVLKDSLDIMMEQIRSLQFERLKMMNAASMGPKPVWFSIDSQNGEARHGDAIAASRVPTGLSALSSEVVELLERHGAALAETRLLEYAPELLK